MKTKMIVVGLFVAGVVVSAFGPARVGSDSAPVLRTTAAASAPLYFVANGGQMDERALYYARTSAYTLWLTRDGLVFDRVESDAKGAWSRATSALVFKSANTDAAIMAADPADYRVSYFYGQDEADWRTDIPTSRAVVYENLYDGVDLKVYGTEGVVEYDWIVAPGARADQIRFGHEGARTAGLDAEGNLVVETPAGRVVHRKPCAFQVVKGRRVGVAAAFREAEDGAYGFALGAYDPSLELVIDPLVLAYSTYLGGKDQDYALKLAVDPTGAAYVAGTTFSNDFPPATQALPRKDMFITKIAPNGKSLVYTAFFPVGQGMELIGLDVDPKGFVYLAGHTNSSKFPLKNAFQTEFGGRDDGFVVKLAKSGKSLVYSSYLGGASTDFCFALCADASGAAYVGGYTYSKDFPTKSAFQNVNRGSIDGFVTKIAPDGGSIVYSTYLGSQGKDYVTDLAVGADGQVTAVGFAGRSSFPRKAAFQKTFGGGEGDGFVSRLNPAGNGLVFSSFLGGSSWDSAYSVALDLEGAIYVVGQTYGSFPVKNAFQKTRRGRTDGFIAKIEPSGIALAFSSFLGGVGYDLAYSVAVDEGGAAYVVGFTSSRDFPVKSPLQKTLRGSEDACLTIVDPTGLKLVFSTFWGGKYQDRAYAIALDGSGGLYLAGQTNSPDFPVFGPYQGALKGDVDVFVLKFLNK